MPIPRRHWLSDLYEWTRTLHVLLHDRVRRPIGECAVCISGVVPGVLREGGGPHYEKVGYVPALQIAIQRAALGISAHDCTAAGMCRLGHRTVIRAAAGLL